MNDNNSPIGIFPNSGHHYVFVPLPPVDLEKSKALRDVCLRGTKAWTTHPSYRWVRYRPGRKKDVLGIWVVIESNLGRAERGFVFEPRREVPHRLAVDDASQHNTPYAFHDTSEVERNPNIVLEIPVNDPLTGQELLKLPLSHLFWERPSGHPIPVDLVVDFGNTRTVALLLEQNRHATFREICHPVRFLPRGTNFEPFTTGLLAEDPFLIADSWLVLHETMFSDAWPPSPDFQPFPKQEITERPEKVMLGLWSTGKTIREVTHETTYAPHMFAEISPALLGGGNEVDSARALLQDSQLEQGMNFFLSSPKRYTWDNDVRNALGTPFWHMLLNRWNPQRAELDLSRRTLPNLEGPVLMFMDTDGRYWPIDEPPNQRPRAEDRPHAKEIPTHPRSDSLTWAALSVIETAYRQLTSQAHRGGRNPHQPRFLRSVLVTFPSGWTGEELNTYRTQWQKAINIFTLTRFPNTDPVESGGHCPSLTTALDEAVAAQLPIIYSEMREESLGKGWLELVGRGQGTAAKARVMNLDIGGGTTDVSVVEYRDTLPGLSVALEATLLFRNSSTVAGDALVKRIIETVLLPAIVAQSVSDSELRKRVARFFRSPEDEWLRHFPAFHQKLARIVRLVFIPIVNGWLKEVIEGRYGSAEQLDRALPPDDMRDANGTPTVSLGSIVELNEMARACLRIDYDLLQASEPLNYDQPRLRRCIREEFEWLFETLGRVLTAFDCDLVLVSGKPSELPDIRELLELHFPLLPQRIVFAKGFHVGEWYPLGENDGRIRDAKTPTVVGAALYQAMRGAQSWVQNWQLKVTSAQFINQENFWGPMPPAGNPAAFDKLVFLKPGQTNCEFRELLGLKIGRKRFLSTRLIPDQVYELRWNSRNQNRHDTPVLSVKLERVVKPGSPETLRLISARSDDGLVTENDVELRLCTLSEREFWMDRPSFEIVWPSPTK